MRKQVCTDYARRETVKYLLTGPVTLTAGVLLAWFELAVGSLWDARDLIPKLVILFLTASGACLLFQGLRGLLRRETTDLCRFLRAELPPERRQLTGKELLALADRDLEGAVSFSGGRILIGTEWLFVQDAWGKPVIRLENLVQIEQRKTRDARIILKFKDRRGVGPVTRELPAAEAGAVRAYLRSSRPDLRIFNGPGKR